MVQRYAAAVGQGVVSPVIGEVSPEVTESVSPLERWREAPERLTDS